MRTMDLFADALWQYYEQGHASLSIERDDGYRGPEDVSWFFTNYGEFLPFEKQALKFAHGQVLDVGCGAGRHSLYLQRRGLGVTAIDISPRIVELARQRGVKDARVVDACRRLPFRDGEFDTVILFGNNLGICGAPGGFRRMLRELYRVTSARGAILGTTRMPSTRKSVHLAYWLRNLRQARAFGQVRLRLERNGLQGGWFELLLFAPTDVLQLAAKEGWELKDTFGRNFEEGYSVVLEKAGSGKRWVP